MVLVTYGPPRTTRLPRALALFTTSLSDSFCTNIAVAKTMSAQSISDVFNCSTLRSTSRRSQDCGSNEETVNNPSGGNAQRLPSNGSACRKLQYVSGNSGLTRRTFIFVGTWRELRESKNSTHSLDHHLYR